MDVPCVRVPREDGERTRQALAEADLLDHDREIVVDEEAETIFLPVVDASAVPAEFDVVRRNLPARDRQRMPAEILGFEPTYERLGDIVILDEDDEETARRVAAAVMASALPVRTVVNRASKVRGELRVREWDVLAHDPDAGTDNPDARAGDLGGRGDDADDSGEGDRRSPTETVHREYGCEFALDIATVYFSPRLATERHRVVEQVAAGERVFDMFAGVGPFVVPFARRGAEVVGTDLNERAVAYLRENARRNGVEDRVTALHGDVRELAGEYEDWADRLVMNLPHSADEFLDTAVALAGDDCTLHYYDIQHEDDPFGPGLTAIREAATAVDPAYDVAVREDHVVRSYAPHELNVCLDVRLTR